MMASGMVSLSMRAVMAIGSMPVSGALMELVATYKGYSAFYQLAELLEELNDVDQKLGRPGPARDIVKTLRNLVLAYGTYEGDTIQIALDAAAPFTLEELDIIRIHPERGVHPDDMLKLLGVSVTHLPGFGSSALAQGRESSEQRNSRKQQEEASRQAPRK